MELIFILTYNCNYRCRYCDIDKRSENMDESVILESLQFLQRTNLNFHKVKFFGGEPTIMLDQALQIIESFPERCQPRFYLTTNGSLLNSKNIKAMKDHGIITTLSLDGDAETTNENRKLLLGEHSFYSKIINHIQGNEGYFRINQVITPKNVDRVVENFKYLHQLGFREFNFLPEYYVEWSKESLKSLHRGFKKILEILNDYPFYLVNSENYSPTSFFNFGMVIDTDGSIYGTNLILSGRFEKYKPDLRIASIHDEDFTELTPNEKERYLKKIDSFLKKEYSHNVLLSVYYVNRILSEFTNTYDES